MLNFFKRDPIREMKKEANDLLKIMVELIAVTADGFASVNDVLIRANLKGRFDEQALFDEICAFHVKTVIVTMNRVAGIVGGRFAPGVEEAYDRNANFLVKAVTEILADARSRGTADTELMRTLTTNKTIDHATEYYLGIQLDVSDEDVLDFGKKYNPKLLSLDSNERANSLFAYIIRVVRVAHVENLPSNEARTAVVAALNNSLMKTVLELESKVEKLAPKG
jgi:hypothetical protein